MAEINFDTSKNPKYISEIFINYSLILIISYIIVLIARPVLWEKNLNLTHTFMELVYIYIAISSFFIIWNSYKETPRVCHLLGFGFLTVSVFDSFHAYYWAIAGVLSQSGSDLQARFWIMGRFVEALILAAVMIKTGEWKINKWTILLSVLFLSIGLSSVIRLIPGVIPDIMTSNSLTPVKVVLGYVIVILGVFNFYSVRDKLGGEYLISYKYGLTSLLFLIPATLCLTLYKVDTNFSDMYGHILKILYSYFLYKALHSGYVEHPYKKLEESYFRLEETNTKIRELSSILKDTLDSLPIGVLNYESDKRLRYMNDRVEEILCCDRQKLYRLSLDELLDIFPKFETGKNSIFNNFINERKDLVNSTRTYRNLKGEYVDLSIIAQNINDGTIIYLNEGKKDQVIRNFHTQTQTILDAISSCVLLTDQNKEIILYNEAFRKLFKLTNIEIIGMSIDEFYKIVDFQFEQSQDYLPGYDEKDQVFNASFTAFSGSRTDLIVYTNPVRNIENEIIGEISVYTDTTRIKRQQNNMHQQEKLAVIGQMATGIVHEIKNPLATIKGLSQLITAKSNVDKVKEYSSVINSAIDDVTKVVNEFLSFAKQKPTVKVRTSINRVVESIQLITETQCYTKNIKSQFYYSHFPMEITADESKIRQVFLNITENAIAAMEGVENPELIVSTYYNSEAKEGVIRIEDNGKGMSPAVIAKLGTPFFTTKEKGTGLGLGISMQIMNEHNGRIDVESVEGKGTDFKIIFKQIEDCI